MFSFPGCKVTIASRNLEKLQAAAEELSKIGDVRAIKCNIRNEDDVRYFFSLIVFFGNAVEKLLRDRKLRPKMP